MNLYHQILFKYDSEKILGVLTVKAGEGLRGIRAKEEMIINLKGEILEGGIGEEGLSRSLAGHGLKILQRGVDDWIHLHLPEGKVEIMVTVVGRQDRLYLVGGDLVSRGVHDLAGPLGFETILLDHREEMNFEEDFKGAAAILKGDYLEMLQTLEIKKEDFVLIATHEHRYDEVALEEVLKTQAGYIGLVSNPRKARTITEGLLAGGVDVSRLHTPAGLKLGGKKPRDIALSIMAEIQALRYNQLQNFQ